MDVFEYVACGAVAFVFFLFVHVIWWQWLPENRKGVNQLVIGAAVAFAIAAVVSLAWLNLSPRFLATVSGPLFAFLVVSYFHLYFGISRSLSIRILGEMSKQDDGVLNLRELDVLYPGADMLARRLDLLVEKGYLARRGDAFCCTRKGRLAVWFAATGKSAYGLDATG